jgi:hypothetical protein
MTRGKTSTTIDTTTGSQSTEPRGGQSQVTEGEANREGGDKVDSSKSDEQSLTGDGDEGGGDGVEGGEEGGNGNGTDTGGIINIRKLTIKHSES